MIEAEHDKLPSRRELRLARQREELARQAQLDGTELGDAASDVTAIPALAPTAAILPVPTDIASVPAPTTSAGSAPVREKPVGGSTAPAVASSARRSAQRKRFVRLASITGGAGVASCALSIAVGLISGTASVPAYATNAIGLGNTQASLLPDIEESESATPESLLATSGAEDNARYHALQTVFDGQPISCEIRTGANSLSSLFVDDSNVVTMPMASGTYDLTSSFGWRSDPFTGVLSKHMGEDFAAPLGTPIYSIADGTVVHAGVGLDGRSSNLIIVQHEIDGKAFSSWYVHMYDDGVHVAEGDQVKAGDHIADVGSNGRATGPHLHFEFHPGTFGEDNEATSPLPALEELGAIEVSELCGK